MGLIDLNGEMGRMFGGLGVAIDHPNVILEAEPSKNLSITGEETALVASLANRFFDAYHTKTNVTINVKKTIPAHMGLGSGTQLAIAVATALAKVFSVQASTQELAFAMGRARRTGVGTAIFEKGGFVVDGGKSTQNVTCLSEKFPPLIFRQEFPKDWRFIVAMPNVNKGLASKEEASAFSQMLPMSAEEAGKICRLTMMKLLPALAEHDIESFGDALTRIQIVIGEYFAQAQGGTYSTSASAECIKAMQKLGSYGVGQSSWGPALYGVIKKEDAKQVLKETKIYLKRTVGGEAFVAKANNKGATIKLYK
jgi:beta-RFAP synthase